MKCLITLLFAGLVLLPTLATTVWKNDGTGGWNDPAQWDNGVPGSGNPAKFIDVTLTFTDADVANLNTTKLVPADNATLIFDFAEDQTITSAIQLFAPTAKVLKKGAGKLTLSGTSSDGYSIYGSGIVSAEEGILDLPRINASLDTFSYPLLEAKSPGSILLPGDRRLYVRGLSGDGTISCSTYEGNFLCIMGDAQTNRYDFSGVLGPNLYLKMGDHRVDYRTYRANQSLAGTFDGALNGFDAYGGILHLAAFGNGTESEPGSLGYLASSAYMFLGSNYDNDFGIIYEGTTDETSSRNLQFRGSAVAARQIFSVDAGSHGGLTFSGEWKTANNGVNNKMYSLCLKGDNAVACTFSGTLTPMAADYDVVLTKQGTGTWNLTCGNKNLLRGPVHVERGTLGYNSVSGLNKECALGRATMLQTNFWGAATVPTVPYAIKIGNGTDDSSVMALATLNYIGSSAVNMAVRPITLDGAGAFSGTTGVPMNWSGFAAVPSGGTLVLDGEATDGGKIVRDLTDGEGVLSLEKRGTGVWTVMGTNTLSGTVRVKEGTLVAIGDRAWYTWFRWTIKNMLKQPASSMPGLQEIALYDTDGVRRNAGLDYQFTGSYYPARLPANLPPGTVTYGKYGYYSMGAANRDLDCCFDDSIASPKNVGWYVNCYPGGTSSAYPDGTEAKYWQVVMHLGETVPKIAQYDFCGANVFGTGRCPGAWSWEGSHDGQTWEELVDYTFVLEDGATLGGYKWVGRRLKTSGGDSFTPGRVLTADDTGFALRGYSTADGMSPLGTAAVRVDPGATLKANGSVTVDKLVVDVSTGAGTLDGVTLADSGTIDCVGVTSENKWNEFSIGSANGTDISVLAGWTVKLNGLLTNRKLTYCGNGRLKLTRSSLIMIIK